MKFFNGRKKPPPEEKLPDNKTLLKIARQYIDEKNMIEAQKCCRRVLKKNNKSYMALVLLGKSFESSDDAPKIFERAIEIKPNNPLAWQGLANYYEGRNDVQAKNKLFRIYNKILKLDIDEDCTVKMLKKQGELACQVKNSEAISWLLWYMRTERDIIVTKTAEEQFLHLLLSHVPIKREDMLETIDTMIRINSTDLGTDVTQLILVKLILKNNDFSYALLQIIDLEIFPHSLIMKQWLCKLLCKTFVQKNTFYDFDIDTYINDLTSGIENTKYGGTLLAIMDYRQGDYREALRKCSFVVNDSEDTDIPEALFMLNCSMMIKDVSMTERLFRSFLTKEKLNNPEFMKTMHKIILSCYIENKKCYEAICIVKKIPIDEMDSVMLIDMAKLYFESDVNNGTLWEQLDSTDYFDLYKALARIKLGRYYQAIAALRTYDKHPVKHYYLAQVYWKINLYDQCLQNLQTAVEFIPNHPKVYYCLGIYYYRYENNTYRSIEYFEKSYNICSTDIDVIKMLSITYDHNLARDLEYNLLETAFMSTKTKEFWVCTRLGRLCFLKGDMDRALIYLEEAIILNSQDVTAYEWIGDVYYNTKAYDQALTAYEKVMELSKDTSLLINCLNRIGSVYSRQTYYDKAIFIFEKILQIQPDCLEALKGLTQNKILNAGKKSANYLFTDARDELQNAINTISAAMSRGTCMMYLHLYGDLLVSLTRLPKDFCFLNVRNPGGESRIGKLRIYEMAIDSYSDIARNRDSYALFKCAHTYLEYYVETKRIKFWHASYNLAVLSIKAKPDAWRYWDLLGKICYFSNKSDVAHYSFFKAIILNGDISAYKVWCNLGTLYLKINKDRLANYCFAVGKKCLPSYPPAWIGDGLLAEIIREDGNVGLFSPNPNSNEFEELSDLDFLDWVTAIHELSIPATEPSFNLALEAFFIVPHRMDIIEWYLTFEQHTSWGCISLGYLQEERGSLNAAATLYQNAFLLADDDDKNESVLHIARILIKQERYDEAINLYGGIDFVNLETTCSLAYALYKAGNYAESYIAYNRALNDLCNNDNELVNVLVPLTNVAYKLNGWEDAVGFLLQVAEITSGPMQTHEFNLAFLKSYAFGRIDVELIAFIMTESIQSHVDDGMWWYFMGLNYLCGNNEYAKLASLCIQRAIDLSLDTEYARNIGKMHAMISIAEFYSGDREEAMDYAKRALNVYPGQPELWAALILCVFSHREWPHRKKWIQSALFRVRQNITLPQSINEWLRDLEEKLRRRE